MSELVDKHTVDDGLYIYLQSNSEVWIARLKIGGRWIARTTKQRERDKATTAAIKVRAECEIKHEHGIAIQTRAFKDTARLAIERMRQRPANVKGRARSRTTNGHWRSTTFHSSTGRTSPASTNRSLQSSMRGASKSLAAHRRSPP